MKSEPAWSGWSGRGGRAGPGRARRASPPWPPAPGGDAQFGAPLGQAMAQEGCVSASDSSPNSSTMSPASAAPSAVAAQAGAVHRVPRPAAPFSVWRGAASGTPLRRGTTESASGRCAGPSAARSRPQARQGPVGRSATAPPAPPPPPRAPLGLDRRRPRRAAGRRASTPPCANALAPQAHRVLPYSEGRGDVGAGPARPGSAGWPRARSASARPANGRAHQGTLCSAVRGPRGDPHCMLRITA
jgi:hypothetical protein